MIKMIDRMKYKKSRLFLIGLILMSVTMISCGQTRQEKTTAIINEMKFVENQKANYEFQIEPLKYQATGNDSIKLIELENKLTDEEIINRIRLALNEVFSDKEISIIYEFVRSGAFEKLFNSGEVFKAISSKFEDIDQEIEEITKNFSETIEKPPKKFEPIAVDREDGFYATVDYTYPSEEKDVRLEDKPALTSKDVLEVKKTYSNANDQAEISLVMTKDGARKFYLLTKENIGKPIAIVIAKQIVSMPTVTTEIIGGKASISGDFSEEEIDKMIALLREK